MFICFSITISCDFVNSLLNVPCILVEATCEICLEMRENAILFYAMFPDLDVVPYNA